MKIPVVKEWGSWAVFGSSCTAALIVGLLTHPWETGREFINITVLTITGMLFLINSKNPLASMLKTKGKKKEHVVWFLFFCISGFLFLIPFLSVGIEKFAAFSLLVISYSILLWKGKEHNIFTELNGFALLTLSVPIVYFVITGNFSLKLYIAVLMYFAAGVFKVRVRIRKNLFFRSMMIFYCAATMTVYYLMNISVIMLLPFTENIVSALWLREEKLKTTGNIELTKSIVFVILMGIFWHI